MKKIAILLLTTGVFVYSFSGAAGLSKEAGFLKELVSISSGSKDVSGVNQVQEKIASHLKTLGFQVDLKANPKGESVSGKQLLATLKGSDSKFITLIGHADTVFEKLNPFQVMEDGNTAKGSGVSDNKGGVVVGVAALERFLNSLNGKQPHFSIRFVVSPSEEVGSGGFEESLKSYAKDSAIILGLEPARENGSIVMGRKGARWISIKIKGKEAHAGVDHESGVNACHELSIKLNQLQNLTDYKKGTTVSIGHIEGGKNKFNIVCGEASAKIDTRFTEVKNGEQLLKKIKLILSKENVRSAKDKTPALTEFEIEDDTPPFHLSMKAKPLLNHYLDLVKEVEKHDATAETTGGAGDVNYMAIDAGLPIIDGLGPVGGGYHTEAEYVKLNTLETRAQSLANFIEYLQKSP